MKSVGNNIQVIRNSVWWFGGLDNLKVIRSYKVGVSVLIRNKVLSDLPGITISMFARNLDVWALGCRRFAMNQVIEIVDNVASTLQDYRVKISKYY